VPPRIADTYQDAGTASLKDIGKEVSQMSRYLFRDRAAIAAAVVAPLVAAAVLLPFRANWPNTNVALVRWW
jgi:hypothetical protein